MIQKRTNRGSFVCRMGVRDPGKKTYTHLNKDKEIFMSVYPYKWEIEPNPPIEATQWTTAVDDLRVYILGGSRFYSFYTPSKAWTQRPAPNRSNPGMVFLNGKIYAFGGKSESDTTSEIFTVATNTWAAGPTMPAGGAPKAAVVGDKIYIVGGRTLISGRWQLTNRLDIYDTVSESWSSGATMPHVAANYLGMAAVDTKIYCFNCLGTNGSYLEIYDTVTNTWSAGTNMPFIHTAVRAATCGDNIFVLPTLYSGGDKPQLTWVYCTETDEWHKLPYMPTRSVAYAAATNGRVYVLNTGSAGWHAGDERYKYKYMVSLDDSYVTDPVPPEPEEKPVPELGVKVATDETVQLAISGNVEDNTEFTFTSADSGVATVDADGLVTAQGPGKTKLTAAKSAIGYEQSMIVWVPEE